MKFLDSNVLAYAFYENPHTDKCQAAIRSGGLVNTFNLIEAFFIIEKETGDKQLAEKAVKGILKSDIRIVEVDVNLVFETLKQTSTVKLSIFDHIHYTCAGMNGCSAIISYDKDFDNLDIQRIEP